MGKVDDFKIYGTALVSQEIEKLYGDGLGDFNRRTIQVTSSRVQTSKIIVQFRKTEFPLLFRKAELMHELSDISSPNTLL